MDNCFVDLIKECLEDIRFYSYTETHYEFAERFRINGDNFIEMEQVVFKEKTPVFVNTAIAKNRQEQERVHIQMSKRLLKQIIVSGIASQRLVEKTD